MAKTNFDELLERELRDAQFARAFFEVGHKLDLAQQIRGGREKLGLSQANLAARVGTTQQQISRLEQAGYRGSIQTLERVAEALELVLVVRLEPAQSSRSSTKETKRGRVGKHKRGATRAAVRVAK